MYEDNGVGIPEGKKKSIFVRDVAKFHAFGLFFIHDILEISGMEIIETGVPGKGSRFEILVPKGITALAVPGITGIRASCPAEKGSAPSPAASRAGGFPGACSGLRANLVAGTSRAFFSDHPRPRFPGPGRIAEVRVDLFPGSDCDEDDRDPEQEGEEEGEVEP